MPAGFVKMWLCVALCIGAYLLALLDPASNKLWCESILELGLFALLRLLLRPFGARINDPNAGTKEGVLFLLVGIISGWGW